MDAKSFFDLVVNMREAQKEYFKLRSPYNLTKAKQLENAVDNEIQRVDDLLNSKPKAQQLNLF